MLSIAGGRENLFSSDSKKDGGGGGGGDNRDLVGCRSDCFGVVAVVPWDDVFFGRGLLGKRFDHASTPLGTFEWRSKRRSEATTRKFFVFEMIIVLLMYFGINFMFQEEFVRI